MMKKQNISETERFLLEKPSDFELTPSYTDDDIVIVDNVKLLAAPDVVKVKMNLFAICSCGHLTARAGGKPFEVRAGQVFVSPPGLPVTDIMVSPDFDCQVLGITNRMLQQLLHPHINIWNQMAYVNKVRVVDISKDEIGFYYKANELAQMCMKKSGDGEEDKYKMEVLRHILSGSLIGLCNVIRKTTDEKTIAHKQNVSYFNRFLEVLQTTEKKHQTVDYYSSVLCITSKYLTVICKKNSGKTANDWIREYTLADISMYLRNTELSVKEICDKLGFPNTSFFGKYVREHFGCTPMEYRRLKTETVQTAG